MSGECPYKKLWATNPGLGAQCPFKNPSTGFNPGSDEVCQKLQEEAKAHIEKNKTAPFEGHHVHAPEKALQPTQQDFIETEDKFGAHNYHPLPVVLEKGEGIYVYDTDGKKYFDFLSAYSAVNQGHCHPRITKALVDQSAKLSLTSRAFHNNVYGPCAKFISEFFGFDKVLPMNTGAEGVETAVKLMRRWAYYVKGIPDNEAKVIWAKNNFHGRTVMIISASTDPDSFSAYGPYEKTGMLHCEYGSADALQTVLEEDAKACEAAGKKNKDGTYGTIAGFIVEPIQGEAGIIVPPPDYLGKCQALLKKHNALLCCDEVQTGLCRTGKMLCCMHSGVRPDLVVLAKALSGGVYPVAAVLADDEVMLCIKPGEHGSTYGGNPVGCAVAMEALKVLQEEKLAENAEALGGVFRKSLRDFFGFTSEHSGGNDKFKFVTDVRGKGLLNAVECNPEFSEKVTAWQICVKMAEKGLLAKPTHETIIRFAPPLNMKKEELMEALEIIKGTFGEYSG